MKRVLLGAVSSLVLISAPALAQTYDDDSGWYLRGNLGYGTHLDAEFDDGLFAGDAESEGDVTGSLGLGYEFGEDSDLDNWRIELDGDILDTDLGSINQGHNSFAELRTRSLMANIIYGFDDAFKNNDSLGFLENFTPYVGAGLGIINADLEAFSQFTVNPDTNINGPAGIALNNPNCLGLAVGTCEVDDSDTTFGWQALAGFEVEVLENLFWDTHYTFRRVGNDDLDFEGTFTPEANFAAAQAAAGVDGIPAPLNHVVAT